MFSLFLSWHFLLTSNIFKRNFGIDVAKCGKTGRSNIIFLFFLGTSGFLVHFILYFLPLMKYYLIFRFTCIFNKVAHRYRFRWLFNLKFFFCGVISTVGLQVVSHFLLWNILPTDGTCDKYRAAFYLSKGYQVQFGRISLKIR